MIKLLITSAGRRVQLIECFRKAAKELKLDIETLTVDINPRLSSACYASDHAKKVPRCNDPTYIPTLLDICETNKIDLIVPTIDTELSAIAEHRHRFEEAGTHPIISSPHAIALSQDKLSTATHLSKLGITVPKSKIYDDFNVISDSWNYPLIFKPNSGSNSQGIIHAANPEEVPVIENETPYLVQERITGKEFTINCFFRSDGTLVTAVPHERIEVRGGEVSKAITREIPELTDIAQKIEQANTGWRGPICFQAIESQGQYYVFEINARFGGGYPVADYAGASFARWIIEEYIGIRPTLGVRWKQNVAMLRYDNAVFIDV